MSKDRRVCSINSFFGEIKVLKFICIYSASKKLYGKMSFVQRTLDSGVVVIGYFIG